MSGNSPPTLSLVVRDDPEPNYNWFGNFDYSWFDNSGTLSSVPFFEAVPELLGKLLETSSARQQLRLGFVPDDCMTVNGPRDCTEACSNPSSLFTPTNLRVCTALASVALLVQNGTYSIDRSDALTVKTMGSFHVPELLTYNATSVLTYVAECISESCAVSGLGECTDDVRSLAGVEIQADNLGIITSRLGRYCDGTNLEISADIAGPGVLLSYFFQSSIALSFYLLLKASTTWVGRLDRLFNRRVDQGSGPFGSKLGVIRSKLESSRVVLAVTSSLVEFQEVQTYFIASVHIATLISYNPSMTDTAGLNDTSYGGVILNAGLAGLLNITSMSCVLLVQCCLQRAQMHWWYIFIMMTTTCVLAVVLFASRSTLMPPAEGLWDRFNDDAPIALCGGNPSPMTYCRPTRETKFLDNPATGYVVCGHIALAWPALFIDQLAFTISTKFPAVASRIQDLDKMGIFRRKNKVWRFMSAVYWFMVELLLPLLVVYNITVLVFVLQGVSIGQSSSWSFGQVIAVAVWAPTIVKFIYFNVFGVKRGFEERIAKSYTITRDGEPEGSI